MKTLRTWTLAALTLAAAGPVHAAGHIKPGQWQMDSQMQITGIPVTLPPVSTKICISPQDAENDTPKNFSEDSGCKTSNLKRDAKSVTADVTCDGRMKGTGTLVSPIGTICPTISVAVLEPRAAEPAGSLPVMKYRRPTSCATVFMSMPRTTAITS